MSLDKKSNIPLYMQLMNEIQKQIRSGKYKEGEQIPTEGEISKIYDVSRITVRRTMEELCKQGYLVKCQGKGTFVEEPKINRKIEQDNVMSFTEACEVNGRKASSHVISVQIVKAKKNSAVFLGIKEEDEVYEIRRILSADDLPVICETIYIPVNMYKNFPVERLEDGSFTKILNETYGVKKSQKGRSIIEVDTADTEIAKYLRIAPGDPVMLMKNYMFDEKDNPLYLSYEIIVGTRYRISI